MEEAIGYLLHIRNKKADKLNNTEQLFKSEFLYLLSFRKVRLECKVFTNTVILRHNVNEEYRTTELKWT